ncbi:unnamed protein product [Rhizophagus irregularis]|nr:unnamed protein product [Rhizophagus irregularis]
MEQFETTWAVLCTGHYLRVCPASHSPDQCAIRRAHVAFLAELPRGSVVANFAEIAKEISAKSVNIPSHIIHTIPSLMPMYISRLLIPKNLQWVLPMPSRVLDLPDMNLMKSLRLHSYHNIRRRPQHPSHANLDHNANAIDIPPLMDWQQITDHITTILEEITYLIAEFAQLQVSNIGLNG